MSMLAKVDALRETTATAVGPVKKAVSADLEVAVHALLRDLAFREVDEAERQSVEESLSTHAVALKLPLLRALGVSALHRAIVLQPVLLERMRRMLSGVPHAGAAGILEKALGADIDASTDLRALKCAMQVLDFLQGDGDLKKQLGDGWDQGCKLPAMHAESCNSMYNRARKAATKLEHELKAKAPEKPLAGTLCVRYETSCGKKANAGFDTSDTHDGRGFTLTFDEIDATLNIRADFEGSISYTLVREDRENTFDARVWLGRERVEGRDGPPLAPRGGGTFCELTPSAQYRIEVAGTRKEVVVGVAAFGNALKLTEDDSAAGEDKASCSCLWRQHVQRAVLAVARPRRRGLHRGAALATGDSSHSRSAARLRGYLPAALGWCRRGAALGSPTHRWGNPCVSEYNCKDWANRFAVSKRHEKS